MPSNRTRPTRAGSSAQVSSLSQQACRFLNILLFSNKHMLVNISGSFHAGYSDLCECIFAARCAGVWKYARYPNYGGEMLVWWGLWLLSIPVLDGGYWVCVVRGPAKHTPWSYLCTKPSLYSRYCNFLLCVPHNPITGPGDLQNDCIMYCDITELHSDSRGFPDCTFGL